MPDILIASSPPVSHIAPLLTVAAGLVAHGDRVTVLTSARHAGKIRAVGAVPYPLPHGADYDDTALDAYLPGRAQTSGIARINFDVERVFVRPLPHQFSALQELLSRRRFDAVLTDAFFLGTLPLAPRCPLRATADRGLQHPPRQHLRDHGADGRGHRRGRSDFPVPRVQ